MAVKNIILRGLTQILLKMLRFLRLQISIFTQAFNEIKLPD